MKKFVLAAALSLPMLAFAQAPNLLLNSSFQSGNFTSWNLFNGGTFPAAVNNAGVQPFGNIVPADNAPGNLSPQAAGNNIVYFVDDNATQVISQTVLIPTAGSYFVGYDYFVPALGQVNAAPSNLFVGFGFGPTSFSSSISTATAPIATWTHVGSIVTLPAGAFTFSIAFVPSGNNTLAGDDFAIDRTYVVAVPEPTTYGLLAAGLVAIGLFARRRSAQI